MSHEEQAPEAGAGPLEAVVVPLDLTGNPADVFAAMAAYMGISLDQTKLDWMRAHYAEAVPENPWERACREWLKGCSCATAEAPWECQECTAAFLAHIKHLGSS